MRAGPNWAAHQTLTAEAATVLRHSLCLARQRRHAQLTPLHVAAALLTTRPSILLKCCIASSQPPLSLPHTLQNRALELCFNVALNRLPTTPTVPFVTPHNVSLSNALVAAMKRAQASQRRGCGELQSSQQIMGVMVELEQLIISILDDPSVSRVMRDAGLSSTAVKAHIEEHFSSVSFHGDLGSRIHEGRNARHLMETITKPLNQVKGGDGSFNCCVDCTYNYEKEAEVLKSRRQQKGVLPYWLQHQSEGDELAELRKKWSSLCQSLHRNCHYASKNTCNTPCSYPWWPTQKPIINPGFTLGAVKLNHGDGGGKNCNFMEEQLPNLHFLKNGGGKDEKISLTLGNHSVSGLRKVLQENVPWQSEKIGPIVEALMNPRKSKKDTWLMIDGDDAIGKRRLVSTIAESLPLSILYFNMKQARADAEDLFDEMLKRGSGDEKILVFVENVDLANTRFIRRLAERFDTEEKEDNGGKLVFVLTKGDSDCNEEANSVIQLQLKVSEAVDHQKRKLDFQFPIKIKKPRIGEKEDPVLGTIENAVPTKKKKHFFFDLNVEAEEFPDGSSPTSSEVTRDEQIDPFSFLESIDNQFTFNRSLTREKEMGDFFFSKLKESFDLVFGEQNKKIEFSIDDALLPKISAVLGFVTNSFLGKWLEEIFQTSLSIVEISGKSVGGSVRLCSGGESLDEEGFLRSYLPKKIDIQLAK